MSQPPNGCRTKQYLVMDPHVAYGQPQNFLISPKLVNYNVKRIVRVGELEQWFATNFRRFLLELTEPKMVEIDLYWMKQCGEQPTIEEAHLW
uniref:Uncharacterized protein n=1 Tax=Romanomermis culicivorax TaxID=13658 RepID=A0A915HV33_ROMCU